MRRLWPFILSALVVACGDDEERIEFSPGEFHVAALTPEIGKAFAYTITGKFGVAEIFQGTTRVSVLTLPDRVASFTPVSTEVPRAVVWGNDRNERRELEAKLSDTVDPCGVLGLYEGEFTRITTANFPGTSCTYPAAAPLQARVQVDTVETLRLDATLLTKVFYSGLQPRPVSDQSCFFVWGTAEGSGAPPNSTWVSIKREADRFDVWIEKNSADNAQQTGCFARYRASFPLD